MNKNNAFDEVLSKVDIVKIISHYEKVEKNGKNYTCLCPFHDDKTIGNFSISEDLQVFNCFSCGKKGNAIAFVKEKEHLSWIDALKKTCQIAGIPLPNEISVNEKYDLINKQNQRLYELMEHICSFYEVSLKQSEEGKIGLAYLYARGLTDDVINSFRIGYSFNDGTLIVQFLTSKGFTLKEISSVGIINLSSNPRDKNAGRVSFPILNKEGKVVGFSCRVLTKEKVESKYINTSSTLLFNKSSLLYNLYNANNEIFKTKSVYLFEGFMDVIAAYRAGFKNSIALMGTALTPQHIQELKSLDCQVNICLDLDKPGQNAMYRIANEFDKVGIPYMMVSNKVSFEYKDSDEIIFNLKEEGLNKFLSTLVDKTTWLINGFTKNNDLTIHENKIKLLDAFLPIIKRTTQRVERENYVNKISTITGFSKEAVEEYFTNNLNRVKDVDINQTNFTKNKNDNFETVKLSTNNKRIFNLERIILKFALFNKEAAELINGDNLVFLNEDHQGILKLISDYLENVEKTSEPYTLVNLYKFLENKESYKYKTNLMRENIENISETKSIDSYSKKNLLNLIDNLNILIASESKKELRQNMLESFNKDNANYYLGSAINLKVEDIDLKAIDTTGDSKE